MWRSGGRTRSPHRESQCSQRSSSPSRLGAGAYGEVFRWEGSRRTWEAAAVKRSPGCPEHYNDKGSRESRCSCCRRMHQQATLAGAARAADPHDEARHVPVYEFAARGVPRGAFW